MLSPNTRFCIGSIVLFSVYDVSADSPSSSPVAVVAVVTILKPFFYLLAITMMQMSQYGNTNSPSSSTIACAFVAVVVAVVKMAATSNIELLFRFLEPFGASYIWIHGNI